MKKEQPVVPSVPFIDEWTPNPEDQIFTNMKDLIIAPVTSVYKMDEPGNINYFWVKPKKCFNSIAMRDHTCLYLNYFEKYFDTDKEYLTVLSYIKVMIDNFPNYNVQNLIQDLNRYVIQSSLFKKVRAMVEANYNLNLEYKSTNNKELQYTNDHAIALLMCSIMINMVNPLICHFAYQRVISDIDEFLLDIYDYIIYAPEFNYVDLRSKIYGTSSTNVGRNEKNNPVIWGKQDIRGIDVVVHSDNGVRNILLNIIPKYIFAQNVISLNFGSIQNSNKHKITDIAYEYSYVPLSSSKREGEDVQSDFDRYESTLTKADEAKYLQSKFNFEYNMDKIRKQYGPFDEAEFRFFKKSLEDENGEIINPFQKELVFNLFINMFEDSESIKGINIDDYIILIMAARKILMNCNMTILAYIISAKFQKVVYRKQLNKKEEVEFKSTEYFPRIQEKYRNEKIYRSILGTVATIITSNFTCIDYHNPEVHGKPIPTIETALLIRQIQLYILMI